MSLFSERGLIIGVNKKLLYVLPIFSYNAKEQAHKNAYHPVDNPDANQDFYLMRASEFAFIRHDSVLKLNDLRSISVNRKLYPHSGRMDINSSEYKGIEALAIRKHFASFYFEHCKMVDEMQNELNNLRYEKNKLEQKLNECIINNESED